MCKMFNVLLSVFLGYCKIVGQIVMIFRTVNLKYARSLINALLQILFLVIPYLILAICRLSLDHSYTYQSLDKVKPL